MRYFALVLCIICLFGSTTAFTLERPLFSSNFSGSLSFSVFTGAPLDEHFTVTPPEIMQNLNLQYQGQTDRYLVEINASSFGVFGASPYVNLPDIKYGFSIDEAYLGVLTSYGTLIIGRYAPLMPVSPNDYRTDGLLFGNPSLPVDAISLYNWTPNMEYEYVLAYLNYSRRNNLSAPSADLLIAARFGFDYKFDSLQFALSPSILFSDLGESFGISLPFYTEKRGHVVEGEIALYNLFGTTLLKEGVYPGIVLRYRSKKSPFIVEGAHIAQNFLPYLGNFANFGGSSNWNTGSSGVKLSLLQKDYTYSFKFEKAGLKSQIYLFTLEKKNLPEPFSPGKLSIGIEDRQAFFNIQTGLAFNF